LSPSEVAALQPGNDVLWVEVEGYGDPEMLLAIERRFEVPRLALEDVLGNAARPKLDQVGEALFIVVRAPRSRPRATISSRSRSSGAVWTVVTFVDEPLEVLTPLRQRLGDSTSLTRRSEADFLVYRILDTVGRHLRAVHGEPRAAARGGRGRGHRPSLLEAADDAVRVDARPAPARAHRAADARARLLARQRDAQLLPTLDLALPSPTCAITRRAWSS
jgi:hypothetical protein